ncbi:MAG: putative hotdog family 3-hydroxylacyl-ACP dehydratase [Bradymonadia bacterium]
MTFPPFQDLVPHEAPMVLLDEMVAWAPGSATCTLEIRDGAPFEKEGSVNTVVAIEYMAQAVAACLGYEAFTGGEGVRVGMIIACRKFDIDVPSVAVGDELRIAVERIRGNEMLSHFNCETWRADERICFAVLTLFHAEEPPE